VIINCNKNQRKGSLNGVWMKMRNTIKALIIACLVIMVSLVNLLYTLYYDHPDNVIMAGVKDPTEISMVSDSTRLSYKPVPDVHQCIKDEFELPVRQSCSGCHDNFLYKKWCEETFDNGNYIYEAYKKIAFDIKYAPEPNKADFWQTPIETVRLKRGDCEDAAFLLFSKIPSGQKNAEIVWGWAIDKQNAVKRLHVWYQLEDKKGQKYIIEGFSKDWNGIIPMEIVKKNQSRIPILIIAHSEASRLDGLLKIADNEQVSLLLEGLFTSTLLQDIDNKSTGRKMLSKKRKVISHFFKKLCEVFSRYEKQKIERLLHICKSFMEVN
jgi:hypothetical protein